MDACCRRLEGCDRSSEVIFKEGPCRIEVGVTKNGLQSTGVFKLRVPSFILLDHLESEDKGLIAPAYNASSSYESNVSGRTCRDTHSTFSRPVVESSSADSIASRLIGMFLALNVERSSSMGASGLSMVKELSDHLRGGGLEHSKAEHS